MADRLPDQPLVPMTARPPVWLESQLLQTNDMLGRILPPLRRAVDQAVMCPRLGGRRQVFLRARVKVARRVPVS